MANAEKASEPTMDEILASIRKIIAEEPAGSQAGGDQAGIDPKLPTPRASIDDILGLADSPTLVRDERSSNKVDASKKAAELPGPAVPSNGADRGEASKPAAEPARAAFPAPSGQKGTEGGAAGAGAPGLDLKAGPSRSPDFGAIVPTKAPPSTSETDDADRRPIAGRLPDWLSRSGTSAPAASQSAPVTAESRPGAARETTNPAKPIPAQVSTPVAAGFPVPPRASPAPQAQTAPGGGTNTSASAPGASAAGASAPAAAGKAAAATGGAPAEANKGQGANGGGGAAVGGAVSSTVPQKPGGLATGSPVPAGAPGNQVKATPNAPTGPGADGHRGAGQRPVPPTSSGNPIAAGAPPHAARPAAAPPAGAMDRQSAAVPVPVSEEASPVPKPAVIDKSKAIRPATPNDLVPTASPIGGIRTLDDTIVDLLRPMIRQWLDDNMPRMVEKALRIEMAASLQAKDAAGKPDSSKH